MKRAASFIISLLCLISAVHAADVSPKTIACVSKMKALLEFGGPEPIGSDVFMRTVLEKAKILGSRERLVGWVCDSSEKKNIPFIMDFAGGGFVLGITQVQDGRIYIAHVQFQFDAGKNPVAVFSRVVDQGPQ